jgi:response regulator RpfG family c-di-GMP phosphodiesterase
MVDAQEFQEIAKNFTVLYVEDDKEVQERLVNYFNKFFLKVTTADDGVDGLALYEKDEFDIVITDISMPKMNGIKMIEKIKEMNSDQAVLITSAYGDVEFMLGAIQAGVDGYIIKPFDFKQLNYELNKMVQKLQKFKENELYKKNLQISVENKTMMVSSLLEFQNKNYEKTLYSMVEMIEDRDTYTAGHSRRVAEYSKMIAEAMGYSEEECLRVYQAGILHDVGKITTPDAVLLNPKTLSDIEYKLVQEHVNGSYKLLNNVPMFASLAEIVYSHHERYDGSGYPRGLTGSEIVPLARIMIVADSFDAMTTNRIYKGRKNISDAIKELQDYSGKQFHPEVVAVAVKVLADIKLDENINQLPKNEIEKMRFAYFYRDILTQLYNENYLELILARNAYDQQHRYLTFVFIKNFSKFNKDNGWAEGNKLLKSMAEKLILCCPDELVFRAFGDDFVIVSQNEISTDKLVKTLDSVINKTQLKSVVKSIDLDKTTIHNIKEIEQIEHEK